MNNVKYYQDLAEKGDSEAAFHRGMIHLLGVGVEIDNDMSVDWFEKSASQGFANAQYILGLFCKDESSKHFDLDRAKELFQLAAKQKYALAQYILGHMYFWGTMGESKDLEKSKDWLVKASRRKSSEAQNMIGLMHSYGLGFEQDLKEARKWFQKAAKRKYFGSQMIEDEGGDFHFACIESRLNLAMMYTSGDGGIKNSSHSSGWFSKAQEMGRAIDPFDFKGSMEFWSKGLEEGCGCSLIIADEADVDFIERHNAHWCLKYESQVKGVSKVLRSMKKGGYWFNVNYSHWKVNEDTYKFDHEKKEFNTSVLDQVISSWRLDEVKKAPAPVAKKTTKRKIAKDLINSVFAPLRRKGFVALDLQFPEDPVYWDEGLHEKLYKMEEGFRYGDRKSFPTKFIYYNRADLKFSEVELYVGFIKLDNYRHDLESLGTRALGVLGSKSDEHDDELINLVIEEFKKKGIDVELKPHATLLITNLNKLVDQKMDYAD